MPTVSSSENDSGQPAAHYFETIGKMPAAQTVWNELTVLERAQVEFRFFELLGVWERITFHPDLVMHGRVHYCFTVDLGFGEILLMMSAQTGRMILNDLWVDRAALRAAAASPAPPH